MSSGQKKVVAAMSGRSGGSFAVFDQRVDFFFAGFEGVAFPGAVIPVDEILAEALEEGAGGIFVGEGEFVADDVQEFIEDMLLTFGAAAAVDFIEGILLEIDGVDEFAYIRDLKALAKELIYYLCF